MPIRLSGLVSNMDTDSIVQELVSSYRIKTNNYKKAQTKLQWKQDTWKELNSKIYKLYSNTLSNLRYSGPYNKKKTSVSDDSKASVIANSSAVIGTQSLEVKQLATTGSLTGGRLNFSDKITAKSTMEELGIEENSTITLKKNDGTLTNITLTPDMKVSSFVEELQNAGINASFDEGNQRFFISSKSSGKENDFTLEGKDIAGVNALFNLGLARGQQMTSGSLGKVQYNTTLGELGVSTNSIITLTKKDGTSKDITLEPTMEVADFVDKLKAEGFNAGFDLEKQNFYIDGTDLASISGKNSDGVAALNSLKLASEAKFNEQGMLIGGQFDFVKKMDYMTQLSDLGISANSIITVVNEDGVSSDITLDPTMRIGDFISKLRDTGLEAELDMSTQSFNITSTSKVTISGKNALGVEALKNLKLTAETGLEVNQGVAKVDGQDAKIVLNGAEFESSTNGFSINGLTITAKAVTENGKAISLTTDTDVDEVYNTIKGFITEYNELIKEMDTLYNASSAKGYEPLTDDEKDAMSDTEVEKWEKKIKDSLLRRDGTLNNVISGMKSAMQTSIEINGKSYTLASFGIKTAGYFSSGNNEKGVYHIDNDSEDPVSSKNEDKLKSMIASDPDTVMEFFSGLITNMYDDLTQKMARSTLSSAFTVYNDKELQTEYNDYGNKIDKWEDYVTKQQEYWYSKFTAMEKALSQLQSNSSALSGLLGN